LIHNELPSSVTDQFINHKISVAEATIDLMIAGEGYPLVLLHGFPETKLAWRKVAPKLAEHFKVIVPDLPGYGDSTGPSHDPKHFNYSKRGLANILISAIKQLGIERFALAGHDRGGRVAYRMALDHPEAVTSLVVLSIIPTLEMMEKLTYATVLSMENWFFLSQPTPLPETMINAMPDFYLSHILESWSQDGGSISQDARVQYLRCFKDPKVIRAICEEYRSSELDLEHDRNDRVRGNRITCPTLVLWPEKSFTYSFGDPLAIWKNWSDDVQGSSLACGHFLMEEAPDRVFNEMINFLQRRSRAH
jgi:haloacetate dehalogenase